MNVYVAETMEHPETGHWTLTGDSAPGHRGSCWSQKHPAAEMGQKEMQVHDLSYIFLCFPIFSYIFLSLCFTMLHCYQHPAEFSADRRQVFSAKQIAFSVTKGTLAQCRHERNVGRAILLGTNVPSSLQVVLWLFPGFQNMSLQLDNK